MPISYMLLEGGGHVLLEGGGSVRLEGREESGPSFAATAPSSAAFAETAPSSAVFTATKGDIMPIILGAENVAGFVFLNDSDAVTTPGGVSVTVTAPDGTVTSWTDSDAEVTLGDTLPTSLQTILANGSGGKFTTSDISSGTGCVSIIHTPTAAGVWWYFCEATSTVAGAARTYTHVLPVTD